MVTNDGTIIKIKHDILCEVAKLVFAGKFEEEKEELPYRMMPGPKAKYRCCVYKEREIVRQRRGKITAGCAQQPCGTGRAGCL